MFPCRQPALISWACFILKIQIFYQNKSKKEPFFITFSWFSRGLFNIYSHSSSTEKFSHDFPVYCSGCLLWNTLGCRPVICHTFTFHICTSLSFFPLHSGVFSSLPSILLFHFCWSIKSSFYHLNIKFKSYGILVSLHSFISISSWHFSFHLILFFYRTLWFPFYLMMMYFLKTPEIYTEFVSYM